MYIWTHKDCDSNQHLYTFKSDKNRGEGEVGTAFYPKKLFATDSYWETPGQFIFQWSYTLYVHHIPGQTT